MRKRIFYEAKANKIYVNSDSYKKLIMQV